VSLVESTVIFMSKNWFSAHPGLVRVGSVLVLGSLFVGVPTTSATAEEADPVVEAEPTPEPTPEPEDTWAVVDPDTGNVLNIIVCTESMCGKDGVTGGKLEDGETGIVGNLVRQGGQNQGGWRTDTQYGGGTSVTWKEEQQSFLVEQKNGADSSSSFSVVPEDGKDFSVRDIGTKNRFRSGEDSATLSTMRSDYTSPILNAELFFPGLGKEGSLLSYALMHRESLGDGADSGLDQIRLDVDSILIEEGFVERPGEDDGFAETDPNLDASHPIVRSMREITNNVITFLSSMLGFGQQHE